MLKEERHKLILGEVNLHNRVLLSDLGENLNVSIDTVRRDVKELDADRKLKKVHGGAIATGFLASNGQQAVFLQNEKQKIAEKAVSLLKEGQVILMSGGTTNLEVVRFFPRKTPLTVLTPSLQVATELLNYQNIEVIFLGGRLDHESKFAIGGTVIHTLSQIKADICFLGTGYLDPEFGLTEIDWEVVQVKRAMITASKKVALLCVSNKLFSTQRYKTCDLASVDILITELDPDSKKLDPFKQDIETII
ncbi:DeoR/GlpR family DNA-binding transcription regulator [Arthrospiribacter ruber]|uniref:DeoR/GlpR transcriptional regulator n=1 Tax=Arthrospiribacter ruber TaxID=2487934 RepID=A0A951IWU8_9BACT|nr:DeoR/GlpR family DNA-binding transcription regulator [Arthrospiribacter ruber]MBW3468328.1 DeoR/GlpR transcriptional regulator [Arthrospiribacter ruber]